MSKGDKSSYSPTQRRKAQIIEEGYRKRGSSAKRAERIAWATVNKQDGGAAGPGSRKKKSAGSKRAGMRRGTAAKR